MYWIRSFVSQIVYRPYQSHVQINYTFLWFSSPCLLFSRSIFSVSLSLLLFPIFFWCVRCLFKPTASGCFIRLSLFALLRESCGLYFILSIYLFIFVQIRTYLTFFIFFISILFLFLHPLCHRFAAKSNMPCA